MIMFWNDAHHLISPSSLVILKFKKDFYERIYEFQIFTKSISYEKDDHPYRLFPGL